MVIRTPVQRRPRTGHPDIPLSVKMTKPPTPAEAHVALQAWQQQWAEQLAAKEKKATDDALQAEWQADQVLAEIDRGRGVVKLMPGMSMAQGLALTQSLYGNGAPVMFWIEQVRRQRVALQRPAPPMPADFLADAVRLHRRNALVAKLKAQRVAAEAEAEAEAAKRVKPKLPPHKAKPRIQRRGEQQD